VFVPCIHLQPGLIFVIKVGAYPSSLRTRQSMPGTNTLAYLSGTSVTKKEKGLMALAPSLSVVSGGRRRGGGGRRRTGSVSGDWIERRPEKNATFLVSIFDRNTGTVFTTPHYLRNLRMGPISYSTALRKTGKVC